MLFLGCMVMWWVWLFMCSLLMWVWLFLWVMCLMCLLKVGVGVLVVGLVGGGVWVIVGR